MDKVRPQPDDTETGRLSRPENRLRPAPKKNTAIRRIVLAALAPVVPVVLGALVVMGEIQIPFWNS